MSDLDLSIDNLGVESIYSLLRKKINENEKDNELLKDHNLINQNNFVISKEDLKNAIKYIPFNEKSNWDYSTFSTSFNKNNLEFPEILSNIWTPTIINTDNGIDITNKIFVSEETIDYRMVNSIIKSNVLLNGNSMFWIFLHLDHEFDENTVVILFSKKEYSQRVVMSFGSFIKLDYIKPAEKKGDNFFIFQKQQLIKSFKKPKNKIGNDIYETKDSCLIKIAIIDEGYDKIKIIAKLNDGEEENELIARIYNQIANLDNLDQNSISSKEGKNYRVMISGSGTCCKVNNFYCETKLKNYLERNRLEMLEGCQCCEII